MLCILEEFQLSIPPWHSVVWTAESVFHNESWWHTFHWTGLNCPDEHFRLDFRLEFVFSNWDTHTHTHTKKTYTYIHAYMCVCQDHAAYYATIVILVDILIIYLLRIRKKNIACYYISFKYDLMNYAMHCLLMYYFNTI